MSEPAPNYPRRPPRLTFLHQNVRPFYFVTFNTHQRAAVLDRPEVHEAFVLFCQRAMEHHVAVGRYVIMPDHIHLFVALPIEGLTLSSWVKSLKSVLGKRLLEIGWAKPHWQEGFFDHVLRHGESYAGKWEYVRQNPVRKNLCRDPEEWPYQGEIESIRF